MQLEGRFARCSAAVECPVFTNSEAWLTSQNICTSHFKHYSLYPYFANMQDTAQILLFVITGSNHMILTAVKAIGQIKNI